MDAGVSPGDLLKAHELIARGDYAEAVGLLEAAIAEDPTDDTALAALGVAFTEAGQHDKAIKALTRSLQLREDSAEAHEALGCALFRVKAYPESKARLERARQLAPGNGGILRNLGIVTDKLGDFSAGTALIEAACRLNRDDYQALYALASVRLRQGDLEKALELLDRIAGENSPVGLRLLAMDHVRNLRRYLS